MQSLQAPYFLNPIDLIITRLKCSTAITIGSGEIDGTVRSFYDFTDSTILCSDLTDEVELLII